MRSSTWAQRLGSQVKLREIADKGSQLKTDREMEKRKKKSEGDGRREEERGRDDSEEKEIGSDQNSRSWILNTQLLLIGYWWDSGGIRLLV